MGALSRGPRTEQEFRAAGVVFRVHGGRTTCAGPRGRAELLLALRAAIAWRVEAMRPFVRDPRWPMPRILLAPSPPPSMGACGCCGEPLPAYRGGDCELCCMALARALDAERSAP